jgi:outer membrane protein TolC
MELSVFPSAPAGAAIKYARMRPLRAVGQQRIAARAIVLATVAGALAFSSSIFAAEVPLTLAEAQRRAVERSRQIPAQEAAIAASRDMAIAAGQLPDPMLKLGLENVPSDGPDQFSLGSEAMTQRRIGISQEFTRSEKRQLRMQRYERAAEKSLAEKSATVASIQRDTALAWLDRYYAEAMAAVLVEQARQVRLEVSTAESAYRAGRGTQADIFAIHSTLVELEDRISELSRRIATAKTVLARWIGDGAGAALEGKPAIDSIDIDAGALETELGHYPQIATLSKQAEVALIEARIAEADKKSDWSVELAYSLRGPTFSNMISVGVSVPLQWDQRNRQDRELASKLALANQASAQRDEALRAYVAEVRSMIQEWQNGLERAARYQRQLIPLARERTKAALGAYLGNKASLTDLLLARRNEIDVLLQALQLEMESARSWARLNFLFPDAAGANPASAATREPTMRQTP